MQLRFLSQMKSWIVQRNEYDNGVAVVKNLIAQLGVKITASTIEENLYSSPRYPSLAALEEVLNKWDFETMAAKIPVSKLSEIVPPAIAFLEQSCEFVLIMSHENKEVTYIHPRTGWVTEPVASFQDKWGGVVLMADPGENSEETDYLKKLKREQAQKESDPRRQKIKIIEGFLTEEDCRYLIKLSEQLYARSATIKAGRKQVDEHRTSFSAFLPMDDHVVDKVYRLAMGLLNAPRDHFEHLQCTSYSEGQEYHSHYDTFDFGSEEESVERGQRRSTLIIYLNDDFEGGVTYFPRLDIRVQPKMGSALVFHNLCDDGNLDPYSYHAGLPVWAGTKYVCNLWLRTKPFKKSAKQESEEFV